MLCTDEMMQFSQVFPGFETYEYPWELTADAQNAIATLVSRQLFENPGDYIINADTATAIHRTAKIDPSARIQDATIIGEQAIIGPNAFLRGGVYVAARAVVGFSSEVKSSFIGPGSMLSHLNFVGDSIIGSNVTLEVGAHIANCGDGSPTVRVVYGGHPVDTKQPKFGAVVGDGSKLGANAVLREGTLLPAGSVIPRLTYIDQLSSRS